MEKPAGKYGTGVSIGEMKLALEDDSLADVVYLRLLLQAAVEKLDCIERATSGAEVRCIIRRSEWVQ